MEIEKNLSAAWSLCHRIDSNMPITKTGVNLYQNTGRKRDNIVQVAHNPEETEMQHRKRINKFHYDDAKQHIRTTQGGWVSQTQASWRACGELGSQRLEEKALCTCVREGRSVCIWVEWGQSMEDSLGRRTAYAKMTQKLKTLDPWVLYIQENCKLTVLHEMYTRKGTATQKSCRQSYFSSKWFSQSGVVTGPKDTTFAKCNLRF